MSPGVIKIENVSPKYGIDIEITSEGVTNKRHVPSNVTINLPATSGTAILKVESPFSWDGAIPTKIRSPITIDPDTQSVSYSGVILPQMGSSRRSKIFFIFLILFIIGLLIYFLF